LKNPNQKAGIQTALTLGMLGMRQNFKL